MNTSTPAREPLALVVLAAGLGKRMGTGEAKVLAPILGRPMIERLIAALETLCPDRLIIVVGYQRERVEACVSAALAKSRIPLHFAVQTEQRGTGDAVRAALPALAGFSGTVGIICGDCPLLRGATFDALLEKHHRDEATVTITTCITPAPALYGRVLRDKSQSILAIREAKDCTPIERAINEINAGVYAVDSAFLPGAIEALKPTNSQGEYYLTDMVEKAAQEGQRVSALVHSDLQELLGVNTRYELAMVESELRRRIVQQWIEAGVTFVDPATAYIDESVQIGAGVGIGPNVTLAGSTVIGGNVQIEGTVVLKDTIVGDGSLIRFSTHSDGAVIGERAKIGPFARLRDGTRLGSDTHIGNFVETKNATISSGAKANHLTYLGDCSVGERTNIGAGTITCNYDGYSKSRTDIGSDVFVGSNSSLVAPVTIEDGAAIGAGSVITKKVEKDSLALTRAPQVSKAGWAATKRKSRQSK